MTAIMVFAFVTLITTIAIALGNVVQLLPPRRNTKDVGNNIRKGILYQVFFLGFSPICIFSLWELTQRDSPAEIVVAVFSLLSIGGALAWALAQIILSRIRALAMHQQAGYTLFTDTDVLYKYGFLYIQYNTQSSFFAAVALSCLFVKSLFISFAQPAPKVQTIAFLIIEPAMLITASVLRPWTDKKTNAVNITIAIINFLNSIFVAFFSGIFGQPQIVSSVMGLILFVTNAALVLVLLVLVLFYSVWTIIKAKDPDAPYRPMSEVFGLDTPMQSATRLTDSRELDDLAAISRGEPKRHSIL
jgi:protein-S-isoprenylcysteine O-methyltransferase Ste14